MSDFKVIDLDNPDKEFPRTEFATEPLEDFGPTTPPKVDSTPTKKRGRGRPRGSTNASKLLPLSEIESGISQFLSLLGMGVSMVNAYDGSVVLHQADAVAKSLTNLAANDPKIHKQLSGALKAGSYAALATATIPIAAAIGANHGMFPPMFLMDTGIDPTIQTRDTQPMEDVNMAGDFGTFDDEPEVGDPFTTDVPMDGLSQVLNLSGE
jgi:hypothetical protein